jgi:hypothetical protein
VFYVSMVGSGREVDVDDTCSYFHYLLALKPFLRARLIFEHGTERAREGFP